MPRFLRRERWSLKPPFHPYPHLSVRAVSSLWHCLSATPYVVTSRVYLRPDRSYAAPRPMEFGLSSRDCRRERPSALPRRLQGGGWKRVWRVGSFPIRGRRRSVRIQGCFRIGSSVGKNRSASDRNGCGEAVLVDHISTSNPVVPTAVLCTHNSNTTHTNHEDPQTVGDPRSGLGRLRCDRPFRRPFPARRGQWILQVGQGPLRLQGRFLLQEGLQEVVRCSAPEARNRACVEWASPISGGAH
jgi:hypothetical protein